MKSLLVAIASCLPLAAFISAAEHTIVVGGLDGLDPQVTEERYNIGLALSGGGARGLSAIGLLKAFEEKHLNISAIAGTSMGGVIGGLYACGYSPDEMAQIIRDVDFSDLFANRPPRSSMFLTRRQERERHLLTVRFDGLRPEIPRALTGAQELTSLLNRLTNRSNYLAGGDFTRFPIPFKTIGTDVVSGQMVVMAGGSLADAMRATMAFPLAFTGVEKGERLLMDGGMLLPVPVDIVRVMVDSSTPVVAVNTTTPLRNGADLLTPVDIANQVTTIMTADKLQTQVDKADFVIEPVTERYSATDFKYCDSIIELGYRQGLLAADNIISSFGKGENAIIYDPIQFDIVCSDTSLTRSLRHSGLDQPFTRRQLIADLKTLARTESVFGLTAVVEEAESGSFPENPSHPRTANPVRLELQVRHLPQPPVGGLHIVGNRIYDDTTLIRQADLPAGLLHPMDLKQAAERIGQLYRNDGYDLAEVKQISIDFDRDEITFVIDEAVIRRIDVAENERSKDWLVRSYFPLRKGEPYSTSGASRGLADLYGTELFERVSLDLVPFDSGALMTIRVKEKKHTQLRLGWHWHDHYQSEEFLEVLDDNVLGIGLEYLIHAMYGDKRQEYYTGLRIDRIFFTYLTARLRFNYNLLDRDLYALDGSAVGIRCEKRWGVDFMMGQQIARQGTMTAGVKFEEVELDDRLNQSQTAFGLRTLHLESTVETFDQTPFPTKGGKHQFELRFAGKLLGGKEEFTRFYSSIETYYPLGSYLNYHPRVSIGLSRRGLPASEKYYLGGLNSFSGYRTNELSGDKVLFMKQEVRVKLPYWFYLFGRWDVGDVFGSADEIKLGNLRQGFGISLAFDSPLGPIELGYGGGDSPKDHFYFSAGLRF